MESPSLTHEPEQIRLEQERLRSVIFGAFGVGKTTLALSAPKPLVIDTDEGLVSVAIKRPGEEIGERWQPTGHKDLEALYFFIRERADDYETIVIDSLDELVFLLMGELVDDTVSRKGDDVSLRMQFVPEQGEYLANQRQMHAFLVALRRLGKHIVITSGVRDDSGKHVIDVAPGLRKIVGRWASVIGELLVIETDQGVQRVLATEPSPKRETKTRFEALLPYVVEPTFDKLWTGITDAYSKAEET